MMTLMTMMMMMTKEASHGCSLPFPFLFPHFQASSLPANVFWGSRTKLVLLTITTTKEASCGYSLVPFPFLFSYFQPQNKISATAANTNKEAFHICFLPFPFPFSCFQASSLPAKVFLGQQNKISAANNDKKGFPWTLLSLILPFLPFLTSSLPHNIFWDSRTKLMLLPTMTTK